MSKNSDFFKTSVKQPRLPKFYKKMLALNGGTPEIRRMFTAAHLTHVQFKLKRNNDKDAVDTSEAPLE